MTSNPRNKAIRTELVYELLNANDRPFIGSGFLLSFGTQVSNLYTAVGSKKELKDGKNGSENGKPRIRNK